MASPPVHPLRLLVLAMVAVSQVDAWQKWDYKYTASEEWKDTWGYAEGPRGRRGHSISMSPTTDTSKGSLLIMFGGRDNEIQREHVPKTYNIIESEGSLEFETYTDQPVKTTYNETCKPKKTCIPLAPGVKSGNTESCSYEWDYGGNEGETLSQEYQKLKEDQCGFVPVGLYYNDVWMYDLDCERYADKACQNSGWVTLHEGARNGACVFQNGKEICTVPSERWHHGSAMFDDQTMLIFGGFSPRCEDYCDDMWSFDIRPKPDGTGLVSTWMEIYPLGHFGDNEAPGKRWKFSLLSGVKDPETGKQSMIFFGGHRLWHGFAPENSQDNNYASYATYPKGGYLNDLWTYSKTMLLPTEEVPIVSDGYGTWSQKTPKSSCERDPGLAWSTRNDFTCTVNWPKERAGHAGIYDKQRHGIWIHGGFTSYYPYINTDGPGSGNGIQALKVGGFTPYPTYPFFLDDLWFYSLKEGNWTEITYTAGTPMPDRRTDHILILATKQGLNPNNNKLIMFGGYYNNHHYDDTWFFDIDTSTSNWGGRWQQKETFVHAFWPETCVDDYDEMIDDPSKMCEPLEYPKDLWRALRDASTQEGSTDKLGRGDILPYAALQSDLLDSDFSNYYVGSGGFPSDYFGVHENATLYLEEIITIAFNNMPKEIAQLEKIPSMLSEGTPIAPFSATGPRQYARKYNITDKMPARFLNDPRLNATALDGVIWEKCTSGKGVPTDMSPSLDGMYGRSSIKIEIDQPKRQRYGWDGCREENVPEGQELWKFPRSRSDHTATYYEAEGLLLFYGGVGYTEKQEASLEVTHNTEVLNDFWTFNINNCNNNCSNHGRCDYGNCICDKGFYGLDCSNSSCPGSFCYYDEVTGEQICNHCCYAGYEHTDDDIYIPDVKKSFCSLENTGSSNGICDGFGTCQCAPPFIGEDCSIKDCKYNCSYNGYCSVEFPVSRCMCSPGYFGEWCQYRECLNNCSWPNGKCDYDTGWCECTMVYNPFENFREWARWGGEDCSYLAAYAGSSSTRVGLLTLSIALLCSLW
eukprot:CAMPEP_0118648420 /NCGR_PEP_ID=MMETSP0785-20121206/9146_1 /TAXON_ID=91992 /ORGANISM="Bolidomonas pacifica, Strain CCMP 1866" /LENGTH=1030 /DNA_ID=CAMNT_0006540611 /DNA_START=234 /DNA_END=3323 /DNA_ORIENTATION=+